jgi:antitoxin HicB
MRYGYAVDLDVDEEGRVVARVADVVGCVTDGADRGEALAEAVDALEEALAAAMEEREDIPVPGPARGRPVVAPGAVMAAKAALYSAMREGRVSNTALAERLGVAESEVRRMLDPRHATKIGRLEAALSVLGRRLVVSVDAAE